MIEWVPNLDYEVPPQYELGYYDACLYNEDVLGDFITKEELKQVFDKLSEEERWVSRIQETGSLTVTIFFLVSLILLILIMFTIGAYTNALKGTDIILAPFAFLFFAGFAQFFVQLKTEGSDFDMLSQREEKFREVLTNFNKNKFLEKNCRLDVGEFGAWIEINLVKKNEKLEEHLQNMKKKIEEEIMNELSDELYEKGILPIGKESWDE